ncbi:MBL fold metallo-hydrolase [Aliivibrio fischeri]|uniref:MBL fold metallo-hydrolase n=1 Tax=Aliivibrio fischeri TaxID=668 RepID=A0A6N3YTZ8_ALIFS|nr:alkyl sulfatase dimerization domain-containing protein [Aliivibrio fischeri]MUK43017.1 MBL fold metallo-hydrolase [Aliivibrio fischeri]MUK43899.1 MBL fold metallo-hydrolase [Aliivibrio fischeri]MUK82284.1 MBL fold metallo-hydrolase [Aliivibrio fischeri]MUK83612.1 MBL fold metallo-hydrolase [Aliivibrio fischeri]
MTFKKSIVSLAVITTLAPVLVFAAPTTNQPKEATPFTIQKNDQLKQYLDFDNKADFENASRGFIATWPEKTIKDAQGNVVWDFSKFDFINQDNGVETINPSLLRQAKLNNINGLFKVKDGVYQVRGFDLSVMSFIRGDDGWIVIDPLISPETAAAGLKLLKEKVEDVPVTGVIFTHSHVDHFGGILGVTTQEAIDDGDVTIAAPEGFFSHSIAENLMAGTTMSRRSSYMYGNLLDANNKGMVDGGLGKTTSSGSPGIVKPTEIANYTGQEMTIDGVDLEVMMAQESEAPSEFMFYFPQYKTMMAAEVMTHTIHNISTLRGAKTRDASSWASYVDQALHTYGDKADTMIASHHWPTWGQENIKGQLAKTRDMYKFVHDQTLRLANKGYTPNEISATIKLPDSLGKEWYNRGYYGTVSHNARATYDYYFGAWWDGNPANLNPLTPTEEGIKYVEAMGGEKKVVELAEAAIKKGEYRWAVTLLNNVTFANPKNMDARYLEADAMEQLGYQSESGPWRNYYLGGAKELRNGIKPVATPNTAAIAVNMPFNQFMKYLGVTVKPEVAKGMNMKVNINVEGDGKYSMDLSNSVLKSYTDTQFENADLNITLSRQSFENMMTKKTALKNEMKAGQFKVSDQAKFQKFMSVFDTFNLWFGVVTP